MIIICNHLQTMNFSSPLNEALVYALYWFLNSVLIFKHSNINFGYFLAVRVGILYLLSGFGGSILSCLFIQKSISVGASGALFGLLGAMLSELLTNWTIYSNKVRCQLLVVLVVTVVIIVSPYLALGLIASCLSQLHLIMSLTPLNNNICKCKDYDVYTIFFNSSWDEQPPYS